MLEDAPDRVAQSVDPFPRVLFGPSRMQKQHVVRLVSRRDKLAVGGVERGVGPLTPDVAADHKGPCH